MDKQLFDDAIGEVPPSTVDVDAVIVRGRRAARLRRVTHPAVAAGVAVVLLTGVAAYSMTPGDDGGVTVGTAAPTSTTAPPASTPSRPRAQPSGHDQPGVVTLPPIPDPVPPPQCEQGDLETVAEAAGRLTRAATKAVRERRPDVQLVANAEFPAGTPRGPLEFYQTVEPAYPDVSVCDVRATLHAWATASTPLGDGNIGFDTRPAFFPTLSPLCGEEGTLDRTHCAEVTGPRGEKILTEVFEFERGTRKHQVQVIRADGTWLRIESENVATVKGSGGPTAPAPPFTVEQLIAIGTDPALTLFP
ncbi:hypothetical protein AB0K14_31440 [Actinosynnema sp. NPDC050801]|uniref:hypothetical protein n=1 Tax=unclassified Actinosynnema TaxID=2637065 RepID=UPI0033C8D654